MNHQQAAAATAPNGYVQIVAGPGTGKTFTLVERILELLRRGIPPHRICLMTFTNAAAREIRDRVLAKVPEARKLVVGTFHSVAIRYLAIALKGPPIKLLDEFDRMEIIREIAKRHSSKPYDVSAAISLVANGEKLPTYHQCHRQVGEYYDILAELNAVDFDLLLKKFYEVVCNEDIVMPFDALLIDEFQDTSPLQLKICMTMGKRMDTPNVTIVGDPDQSIYGFRSAEPRNFKIFCDLATATGHAPHIRVLEINYRSTGQILNYASTLIRSSHERFGGDRRLKPAPDSKFAEAKVKPRLFKYSKAADQAEGIQKQIADLVARGVQPSEIAVLCRTSQPLMEIESHLSTRAGLRSRVLGGGKFAERYEIRTILDYLRVANDPGDARAIMRTINNPKRKLGDKTVNGFFAHETHLRALAPYAKRPKVAEYLKLVQEVVDDTTNTYGPAGLQAAIQRIASKLELDDRQKAAVRMLEEAAGRFELDEDIMPHLVAEGEELTYLHGFLFNWTMSTEKDAAKDCITLSTVHSAKGLEWPVVIFANLSGSSWGDCCSDEERRVIYVALTRAKALLMVTYCLETGLHPLYHQTLRDLGGTKMSRDLVREDYTLLGAALKRTIDTNGILDTITNTPKPFRGFSSPKPLARPAGTENHAPDSKRSQVDTPNVKKKLKLVPISAVDDPYAQFGGFVSAASLLPESSSHSATTPFKAPGKTK